MIERIAHITDLHLDEAFPYNDKSSARERFCKVLEHIAQQGITNIVCTGDIGTNEGVPYFFDLLKKMKLSLTLGNHDSFNEVSKHYEKGEQVGHKTNKMYWSEVRDFFKLVFLDSSAGAIDLEQINWLKKQLVTAQPIIIFLHHPIIGLPFKVDDMGKLKNRKKVLELLSKVPNKITVFCGHYHMESNLSYENITQCISPAVVYQIKKTKDTLAIDTKNFGYRIIQMEPHQLTSKVEMFHAD